MLRHVADSVPDGGGSSLAITAIFVGVASTLTGAAAVVNAVTKLVQAVRGSPSRRPQRRRPESLDDRTTDGTPADDDQ